VAPLDRRVLTVVLATAFALSPGAALQAAAATVATDDTYSVAEDVTLTEAAPGVLANDDPASPPPTAPPSPPAAKCITAVDTSGLNGTLASGTVAADGSFSFTPTANWNGQTSFTYGLATDPGGGPCPELAESTAIVTITVQPVNDAPTATGDTYTVRSDRTLNIAAPGILANDGDVDVDSLTALQASAAAHGKLTLAASGAFSYTPNAGYVGPDAFTYRASDGSLSSPIRAVVLTVTAPPATPTPPPAPTITPTEAPVTTPEPTLEPTLSPEPSIEPSASPGASASASPTATPLSPLASSAPTSGGTQSGDTAWIPLLAGVALVLLIGVGAGVFYARRRAEVALEDEEPTGPG
jgi:hypothetical protein